MLSIWLVVSAVLRLLAPTVHDLEELPEPRASALRAKIARVGVLTWTSQLGPDGRPIGLTLDERDTLCPERIVARDVRPFGGGERDASQCGGYFVTDRLFLTAAHCLDNVSYGDLEPLRIGRGYTAPDAPIELFTLGHAMYSSRLGKGISADKRFGADWVLVEACREPAACADAETFESLVASWRGTVTVPSWSPEARAGDMIHSPLGFHLHVSGGIYRWRPDQDLLAHWMLVWQESSGGPVFDRVDGSLVGIQQGTTGPARPHCVRESNGECTVHFSRSPANSHFVALHRVVKDLDDAPTVLDIRDLAQREQFQQRVDQMRRRGDKRNGLREDTEVFQCIDCNGCKTSGGT